MKGRFYDKIIAYEDDDITEIIGEILNIIKESRKDLPMPCRTNDGMAYYHYSDTHNWLDKWFGDE